MIDEAALYQMYEPLPFTFTHLSSASEVMTIGDVEI